MRGFVSTPAAIVDHMVSALFAGRPPSAENTVLDPGCGPGAFIEGILRWCADHDSSIPRITGVEQDPQRHAEAAAKFRRYKSISIVERDFLKPSPERFDYVIGNPPYVGITHLSEAEKARFRAEYVTARGRFDLYLLFFEQALRLLKPGGRLVFITPEKFLYVKTAEPFRKLLASLDVREIRLADEETFGKLVTYPTITTVDSAPPRGRTRVVLRNRATKEIQFPDDGSSLLPLLNGSVADHDGPTLADICIRVSCGVATGADEIFVVPMEGLPDDLARFAHPTISGRQLVPGKQNVQSDDAMLAPYDERGRLLPLDRLDGLASYLSRPEHKRHLGKRVCARKKPWYAFHDSFPLDEILRPKLLCKDITEAPGFWIDREGSLVPRHSVYYVVPRDSSRLDEIAAYLNGPKARAWLRGNCQRAANDFLRLQSAVLKRLPVPERFLREPPLSSPRIARVRQAVIVVGG